jgi:hypothetical protein
MAGRYGVWAITVVVAASLSVGGAAAAVASTGPSAGHIASTASAGGASDVNRHAVTETPTAEVPSADTESTQATPLIMMAGLAMLGFAILLVVRSGSTRQIDDKG